MPKANIFQRLLLLSLGCRCVRVGTVVFKDIPKAKHATNFMYARRHICKLVMVEAINQG